MFNKKLRLFRVHYVDRTSLIRCIGETIVVAKDDLGAVKQFYNRAIHVGCDITKIEEYEVGKIEQ